MAKSKIPHTCKACGIVFLGWTGNASNYCSMVCYHSQDRARAIERFWSRVKKTDYCWLWTGPTAKGGYGKTGVGPAHQVSWIENYGPIPEGLQVCHKCDNPPCVNPVHLFLGTTADNSADMVQKGRSLKGRKHPMVIVNEAVVREIRAAYVPRKNGGLVALAQKYGLAHTTVHAIVTRKIWKHI